MPSLYWQVMFFPRYDFANILCSLTNCVSVPALPACIFICILIYNCSDDCCCVCTCTCTCVLILFVFFFFFIFSQVVCCRASVRFSPQSVSASASASSLCFQYCSQGSAGRSQGAKKRAIEAELKSLKNCLQGSSKLGD